MWRRRVLRERRGSNPITCFFPLPASKMCRKKCIKGKAGYICALVLQTENLPYLLQAQRTRIIMKSAFYTRYEGKFAFTYALLCNSMNKLSFCSLCSTLISVAAFYNSYAFSSLPLGLCVRRTELNIIVKNEMLSRAKMRETFQFQKRCWKFTIASNFCVQIDTHASPLHGIYEKQSGNRQLSYQNKQWCLFSK